MYMVYADPRAKPLMYCHRHLVKKSGVSMQGKPRYYQGLTVYGKKR